MKRKIFIALACVIALVAILLVTLFVLRGKSPPVSDADLKFVRITVSSNENAFFVLEEAREKLSPSEGGNDRISRLLRGESWEQDFVSQMLQENQDALQLFDRALLFPGLQVPAVPAFDADFNYLGDWKRLAQLSALRSAAQFHEGKEKEAFDSTLNLARFGQKIEDSQGVIIHYLVGQAIKAIALRNVRQMAGSTSLSCDSLKRFLRELDQLRANEAALTNVIKLEYQLQSKFVDDVESGKAAGFTNFATWSAASPFFNPGRTRGLFANFARIQLQSIPRYYHEMPANRSQSSTNRSTLKLLLSGNAVGKILAEMTLPAQEKFLSKKCRENVDISATQVILAMKCHQAAHGALPKSLNDLVPEFLPAIAIDDFDGKPLRYSPEKKIIYSIGQDLIDSAGEERDSKKDPLDIPYKIGF